MVIIEVDCGFDGFNNVLGKHSWSNILLEPTPEQLDKSSEIFYCTLNTGRLVEKSGGFNISSGVTVAHPTPGWKRIWIEDHWFKGWKPDNE